MGGRQHGAEDTVDRACVQREPEPNLEEGAGPTVAALLRRPALVVRRRVMDGLRGAGFDDIQPAHLGVFQHPGPDGVRPGVLARRNQASKQAMNHLLHQLEAGGYLVRETHPLDRRTRVVRLTERGRAAALVMEKVLAQVEADWEQLLGGRLHRQLNEALLTLVAGLDLREATS